MPGLTLPLEFSLEFVLLLFLLPLGIPFDGFGCLQFRG